jgi:metal-dependent amidase/aminoacylase/carboxypeptidase family protein
MRYVNQKTFATVSSFLFIGNGEDSAPLHNPTYDFNDGALAHGAQVFTAIVRHRLGRD